jgi:hypothetical protein
MKVLFRFLTILVLLTTIECTTPYEYQTNGFDDVITIEATITDQYKTQEIKLTRTYKLEEKTPTPETKAIVFVTDDQGNKYDFKENATSYTSINQFQASPGRTYELHIRTQDGRSYVSSAEKLTQQTQIESVNAAAITKEGVLGVEITVNSNDPTNSSKYYRYEYEETTQIFAPKWYPEELVVTSNGRVTFQERTTEARICYNTEKSNTLLLTNTSNLSEDKVTDFPIRFISSKDHIIRNRYSILVKQYVQSLAAHTFSETLKEISDNGSILSQTQPGFFYGNIKSVDNPSEKVIGYFDVSSYSEKRIFFNFTDLFPKERRPEYQYDCPAPVPESEIDQYFYNYCFSASPLCQGNLVVELIRTKIKVFFPNEGPQYLLYPIECGDCTSFSSNIKPSFWID